MKLRFMEWLDEFFHVLGIKVTPLCDWVERQYWDGDE